MEGPVIREDCVQSLLETKFIKVFDLQYAPGKHYYNATRRNREDLMATKSEEAFQQAMPDAVTCIVILQVAGEEPKLLMSYEYRYPAGRFLLSPPAGLMDPEDAFEESPLFATAKREIFEETGIVVGPEDRLLQVSPYAFSTPGMTDEGNALVAAVVHLPDLSCLNQEGAVGSECFDGFELLTRAEAKKVLKEGVDRFGHYYSIYTLTALMYFVSGMWEEA